MSSTSTDIQGKGSPTELLQERDALNRALLAASASLAEAKDHDAILRFACDILVTASPRIRLAWMYLGEAGDAAVRPSYAVGPARACAPHLGWGGGPRAQQWRESRLHANGQPVVSDIRADAQLGPGRERALENQLETCVCLPFSDGDARQQGLVMIYADQPDYFQRIGLHPFIAFAQLGRVAFEQATNRKQLQDMATIDALTGLLNRGALQKILESEHAQSQRSGHPYTLLLLDVDRFKMVNDTYGHSAGDTALAAVASIAERSLREGDWVARWGGDEFLCLLTDADDEKGAVIAERLRAQVAEQPIACDGRNIPISISVGLAHYPQAGDKLETVLTAADAALYSAKRRGRNRVVSSSREARGVFSIAGQLESALQSGRLQPAFQPIVELDSGRVVGEEALARIITEEGNLLEAAAFIQAAKQLRIVRRIDSHVMREVVQRWVQQFSSGKTIARFVNVSADLLRHPELVDDVLHTVMDNVSTGNGRDKPLVIEITEREFLNNPRELRQILAPFLDYGMQLAIDDFGSGYSSFQYLADLPVTYLKIDGALVRRVPKESKVRAILKGIRDIADDLNLTTLAEWVEDEVTSELLKEIGIHWAQGYYFGRPQLHAGKDNILGIR